MRSSTAWSLGRSAAVLDCRIISAEATGTTISVPMSRSRVAVAMELLVAVGAVGSQDDVEVSVGGCERYRGLVAKRAPIDATGRREALGVAVGVDAKPCVELFQCVCQAREVLF